MLPQWLVITAQIESNPGSGMLSGVSSWALVAIMFMAIFAVVIVVAGLLASSIRRSRDRDQRRPGRVIRAGTPIKAGAVDPWTEAGRRTPVPPPEDADPESDNPADENPPGENPPGDSHSGNTPPGEDPSPGESPKPDKE